MRLFGRGRRPTTGTRGLSAADAAHLANFVATRRGVEAYVEPKTVVTEMTIVLIAHDGEYTRRRIGGPSDARELGRRLGIPVYDTNAVGYPRRMREWAARQRRGGHPD